MWSIECDISAAKRHVQYWELRIAQISRLLGTHLLCLSESDNWMSLFQSLKFVSQGFTARYPAA